MSGICAQQDGKSDRTQITHVTNRPWTRPALCDGCVKDSGIGARAINRASLGILRVSVVRNSEY